MNAFKNFFKKNTFNKMMKNPSELQLGGQIRVITVSVTNMTDFVGIAEKMPLETLPEFMNKYYELNCNEISKKEGCIDKFIGDKILAFWSLLETEKHHAQLACESALAQIDAMHQFYDWAKSQGYPCPKIRIGISTGELMIGNLGSRNRMDYTVMGHDVNVAFTLQEVTKEYNLNILVSENTRNLTSGLKFGEAVSVDSFHSKINAYPLFR